MEKRRKIKYFVVSVVSVLFGVFILLSLMDRDGRYVGEKELYRLNLRLSDLAKDPEHVPQASFHELANDYKLFLEEFHGSHLVPLAYISLSQIRIMEENEDAAIDVLNEMYQKYLDNKAVAIQAIQQKINIYAKLGKIEEVLKNLKLIERDYPLSRQGLNVPILRYGILKENGRMLEADNALKEATNHYLELIQEYDGDIVGFNAGKLLSQVYALQEDWESSIDILGVLLIDYAESPVLISQSAEDLVRKINTIAIAKLNDIERPVEIYSSFIGKYPGHPFNAALKDMISNLNGVARNSKDLSD